MSNVDVSFIRLDILGGLCSSFELCVHRGVQHDIYIYIYDMSVRAVLPLSSSRLYTEAIKSKFNSRAV